MAEEPTATETKPEPESFSPASAVMAVNELYEAVPKTRRGEYLGHLNEILVVLQHLGTADGRDSSKAV